MVGLAAAGPARCRSAEQPQRSAGQLRRDDRRQQSIGGAAVTDDAVLAVALHLCDQELSLREIAERLVISTGKKKGRHPSAAPVMRMLRDHDERALEASDDG
ncbi:hypothetical protein [Streptomyces sp. NPDC001508]|uniref:hypothetical protein n=1 Tax=Streptomyces sp. NPDC001508 TaxID=3154656 RepID=UPI003324E0D7